jgi:hypothetical protein
VYHGRHNYRSFYPEWKALKAPGGKCGPDVSFEWRKPTVAGEFEQLNSRKSDLGYGFAGPGQLS